MKYSITLEVESSHSKDFVNLQVAIALDKYNSIKLLNIKTERL